jgi:ABC-2 type transport system permease protein
MSPVLLVARRELGAYFRTWLGYIIIAAAILIDGILFNAYGLSASNGEQLSAAVLHMFYFLTFGVAMFASVFIAMPLLAAERESGTLNLLYSSPISDGQIVVGKFLAALGFLAVLLACTLFMPLLIKVNGKVSLGHMAAGYLGLLLVGSAAIAVGTLGSALTRSQILSVIASAVMVATLVLSFWIGRATDRPLSQIFDNSSFYNVHFVGFQQGIIHLRDVVYYLAVTYVALFSATRVLEARRWR